MPITYPFETQIEIRLNRYLKDVISHLLEFLLEREKHSICAARVFLTKFSQFYHTKEF